MRALMAELPERRFGRRATTMRDCLRGTDLAHLPDRVVQLYDDGAVEGGALRYQPLNV